MADKKLVVNELTQYCDSLDENCPLILLDALALLKEQDETIKELQSAYGYLQKQFFEAQDKLLKEQQKAEERHPVIVCPHCGRRVV